MNEKTLDDRITWSTIGDVATIVAVAQRHGVSIAVVERAGGLFHLVSTANVTLGSYETLHSAQNAAREKL